MKRFHIRHVFFGFLIALLILRYNGNPRIEAIGIMQDLKWKGDKLTCHDSKQMLFLTS